jgi:ssDNA-binding Zn-finger/Zn-ribbon topoisomerase 1
MIDPNEIRKLAGLKVKVLNEEAPMKDTNLPKNKDFKGTGAKMAVIKHTCKKCGKKTKLKKAKGGSDADMGNTGTQSGGPF